MARADVNPSLYASSHSNLSHLSSPCPKRSRLSLRRTTQYLHKPCYREDDTLDAKLEAQTQNSEVENIDMIDLTRDENKSPNCSVSSTDPKPELSSCADEEENKVRVWTIGLPNCGNTCYVNSILQVLRYTPEFLNSLHFLLLAHHHLSKASLCDDETKEIAFFKQMHLLFSAMKRKEALMRVNVEKDYSSLLLRPVKLVISCLREVCVLFEEGEQHDAHEFLITTISAFSTACQSLQGFSSKGENSGDSDSSSTRNSDIGLPSNCDEVSSAGQETKKPMNSAKRRKLNASFDFSPLDKLSLGFEGKIRHIVQCLECEKRLEREENFANLEINIPESVYGEETVQLTDCLSQTTMLRGENKYYCEECLCYNEARMSSEVVTLPPILLFHFSWLRSSSEVSNVEKSNIKVTIPQTLETSDNSDIFCRTPDQNYKLYAVVLHIGRSTEGGHYVSFVKDASPNSEAENNELQLLKPKQRTSQFASAAEQCCTTQEIANFKTLDSSSKWLLFDDNVVSPVCIDDSDFFPYYNYLSTTASPCMIFYHKT